MKIFKCPKCGHNEMGCYTRQETFQRLNIDGDEINVHKEEVIEEIITGCECSRCEYKIKNKDGTKVTTQEEIFSWIEENGVEE